MGVDKFKNGKAAGKNEVTGEMIKGDGLDLEGLCNMAFESSVVPEDWRCVVIVPLYKGKGEKSECKNYRGISLLSVVGKIYAGILVDRIHRVTGGLICDGQGGVYIRSSH